MNISEFRKKYPQYNDMSDDALADSLYSKHYSDMPRDKFNANFLGGTKKQTGASGSWGDEMKKEAPRWKRALSDTVRDVLPPVLGTVGSIVGGGGALLAGQLGPQIATPEEIVTVPAGATAGGAIGYGIGKQGSRILDQALGLDPAKSITEEAKRAAGNLQEGVIAEGVGLLTGGLLRSAKPVTQAFANSVKGAGRSLTPLSEKGAAKVVGELLKKFERTGDKRFLLEAQQLEQQVPGLKLTAGMAARNPDLISLERSAITTGGGKPGMETVKTKADDLVQGNITAIRDKTRNLVSGEVVYFTDEVAKQKAAMDASRQELSGINRQATGQAALETIEQAKTPVQRGMAELESQIPDYPTTFKNTEATLDEIINTKNLNDDARNTVKAAKAKIAALRKEQGETTQSLMGMRRTINGMITDAGKNNPSAQPLLIQVKEALDADLAQVSQLTRTGKMATYQGQAVFPDQLAAELEDNMTRIATMRAQVKPDTSKGVELLSQRTGRPYMQMPGETAQSFESRLAQDLKKAGLEMPTIDGGDAKIIANLENRNRQISEVLQNVEPGQDVAAALNAYNKYASDEYFNRFDTQTMKNLNRVQKSENLTQQLASQTGVDDLIKAVGVDDARRIMQEHYSAEFGALLEKNPNDARMLQWLRSNAKPLGKAGLYEEFKRQVNAQSGYNELTKILGSDPQSLFTTILSGNAKSQRQALLPIVARVKNNPKAMLGLKKAFTDHLDAKLFRELAGDRQGFRNVAEELKRWQPTIDVLFNREEKEVLRAVRKAAGITQTLTNSSPLGGSQTAELQQVGKRLMDGEKPNKILTGAMALTGLVLTKDLGMGAQLAVGGSTATTISMWRNYIKEMGNERVRQYFVRAMFDPAYAKTLIAASKSGKVPTVLQQRIRMQIGRAAAQAVFSVSQGSQQEQQPGDPPQGIN